MTEFIDNTSKDEEIIMIQMESRFKQVRFVALMNEQGEYLGTREVNQAVTGIRDIEGDKRLINE